ncbi:neural cell adhesion molecule 1-B-like [Uloborus diversus]|uniref:neural cell adhesion molecule 1-B-like n=1 Tax=Uloborus diversus TaxID=327109 RepID=UPI00240A26C0|nr:neural cell adhesion molecule 1-B-like [Uloborus diversus]
MFFSIGLLFVFVRFPSVNSLHNGSDISIVYAVVGDTARIPCNLSTPLSDDEASLILWYRSNISNPIYTLDARNGPIKSARHFPSMDTSVKVHFDVDVHPPTLVLTPVEPAHAAEYRCRVDLRRTRTLILHSILNVIVPPREPIIMDEHGQRLKGVIGPYDEGSILTLICDVDGGYPSPSVTWWEGKQLVDDDFNVTTQGFVRNTLVLPRLQRADLMKDYTCKTSNTNLTKSKEATVYVDLNLRPLEVKILGARAPMFSGEDQNVTCETTGSRPQAVTTWSLNGQTLDAISSDSDKESWNFSFSVVRFKPTAEDNGKKLICRSSNPRLENSTIQDYMIIRVNYAPILNITLSTGANRLPIHEGSDVYLECHIRASPWIFEVVWQFENETISENRASGFVLKNQTLMLQNVQKKHRGRYRCLASNSIGQGESDFLNLLIQFSPTCRSSIPKTYGVAKSETVNVTCEVDADPDDDVIFRWSLINSIETSILQDWHNISKENVLIYSPRTDDGYGMLSCWGRNSVGIQMDPCVFKVVPAGPPDPPHDCIVSNQSMTFLSVECSPGWHGSLSTVFHLEIYDSVIEQLVQNLTAADRPSFRVGSLSPDTSYVLVIYASNYKGRSESVAVVTTTLVPSKTGDQVPAALFSLLVVAVTVFAFLLIFGSTAVLILRFNHHDHHCKTRNPEAECETEKKEVEESQDTSEKGPDIIPTAAESEIFLTEELSETVQHSPHLSTTSKDSFGITYMHTVL